MKLQFDGVAALIVVPFHAPTISLSVDFWLLHALLHVAITFASLLLPCKWAILLTYRSACYGEHDWLVLSLVTYCCFQWYSPYRGSQTEVLLLHVEGQIDYSDYG